jgi:hypothetical protein
VAAGTAGSIAGRVVERRYGGPFTAYHVAVGDLEIEVLAGAEAAAPGEVVALAPNGRGPAPRIFPRSYPAPDRAGGGA